MNAGAVPPVAGGAVGLEDPAAKRQPLLFFGVVHEPEQGGVVRGHRADFARQLFQPDLGLVQPVLPRRTEDVHVEGVLERDGLMGQVGRQVKHFAHTDRHLA